MADEINLTALILPYVVPFISSLLIFLIGYTVSEWNKSKESRKKRTVWIKFLKSNKTIDDCLQEFENMMYPNRGGSYFSFGFTGTLFLFLFLTIIFSRVLNDQWLIIAYSILLYIAPLVLVVALMRYIESETEKGNLLNKSTPIMKRFIFIGGFIFMGWFLTIFSIILIFFNLNQIPTSDLPRLEYLFLMVFMFLLLASLLNKISRRGFFDTIKDKLNEKYINGYPHIDIKTKTGEEIEGKIQNIFHEDLIILDNNGTKEIAVWDEISTLKSTLE